MASNITIIINRITKEIKRVTNLELGVFDSVEVYKLGIFYNEVGNRASLRELYDSYIKYDTELYNYLDGVGTIIVLDHNKNKLYAFTDYFNSIMPLFYAEDKEKIVISTDMLNITEKMSDFSISPKAAKEFILHGMNFGDRTLIKQIHKLPAKHYWEVDLNRCKLHSRKCHYSFEQFPDVSIERYNSVFSKCVGECYRKNAGIAMSGGFDTNFLIHYLQQIKKQNSDMNVIQSYCGGGITGKDETSLVREIVEYYGNIDLHTFHVNQDSLQHYPEIVLALQGTCFEDGVFLHYQMAKMFCEDNIKYVYTGDLADQVLNFETYKYTRNTYKRIARMSIRWVKNTVLHRKYNHYDIFRGRYETGALKNLKKGGLLWDYFGAAGIYPYVRKDFLSIAKSVSAPGDYGKSFHKRAVLNTVDSVIAQKIKRNGGNTDPTALFSEHIKDVLRTEIKGMPWYINLSYINEDQQLGYELRVLYVDLVRRIFINRELGTYNVGEYPLLKDMYPSFK